MENLKYEFMENLADEAHQVWSSWMKYMLFGNTGNTRNGQFIHLDDKEYWVMTPSQRDRWERQLRTDYTDLSESEQQSDRNVVREHHKDLNNIKFVGEFNHNSSLWTKLQQQLGCTLQRGKYKIVLIRDDEK